MTKTKPEPGAKVKFASGAVRCSDADNTRYDLVTPVGLRRVAEAYAEGAVKYSDNNWLKGIPASNLMNHAIRHLMLWLSGDTTEDHLGHAAWNLFALMHFEETRPELIDVYGRTKPFVKKEAPEKDVEPAKPCEGRACPPDEPPVAGNPVADERVRWFEDQIDGLVARRIFEEFRQSENGQKTLATILRHFPKLADEYGYAKPMSA